MLTQQVAVFTLSVGLVTHSNALVAGDDRSRVAAGQILAKGWCAHCHVVSEDQRIAPVEGVPTFLAIASDPSTTDTSLRVFLVSPHVVMPDFMLTGKETDDIIAYILSLRTK
jgi:mono/diheme cytochrome c family protein